MRIAQQLSGAKEKQVLVLQCASEKGPVGTSRFMVQLHHSRYSCVQNKITRCASSLPR